MEINYPKMFIAITILHLIASSIFLVDFSECSIYKSLFLFF